jgi:TPR repeat protein
MPTTPAKIHVAKNDTSHGPFSEEELAAKLAAGEFSPTDLFWQKGQKDWLPLSELLANQPPPRPSTKDTPPASPAQGAPSAPAIQPPPPRSFAAPACIALILLLLAASAGLFFWKQQSDTAFAAQLTSIKQEITTEKTAAAAREIALKATAKKEADAAAAAFAAKEAELKAAAKKDAETAAATLAAKEAELEEKHKQELAAKETALKEKHKQDLAAAATAAARQSGEFQKQITALNEKLATASTSNPASAPTPTNTPEIPSDTDPQIANIIRIANAGSAAIREEILVQKARKTKWERDTLAAAEAKLPQSVREDYRAARAAGGEKGLPLMQRAADNGHPRAQLLLGFHYFFGHYKLLPKDDKKAFEWWKKSAEQGYAEGEKRLAEAYYRGIGTTKNTTEANRWFQKAAEKGEAVSQRFLGTAYYQGLAGSGVSKDHPQATRWYLRAALQGDRIAQFNLGALYDDGGQGIEKKSLFAFTWYRFAAEQGDSLAWVAVGHCYAKGIGVKKDTDQARTWYQKAKGTTADAAAKKNLAELDAAP